MLPDTERAIVDLIGKRFISHNVKYAEQWQDGEKGGYKPVEGPLTRKALGQHLQGTRSLGHYLVSPMDSSVKLFAYDLDARKALSPTEKEKGLKPATVDDHVIEDPRAAFADPDHPDHHEVQLELWVCGFMLAKQIRLFFKESDIGRITCGVAFSGSKGVHVYGWFEHKRPAKEARMLAEMVLKSLARDNMIFTPFRGTNFYRNEVDFPAIDVEIFPKQDSISTDGSGNLMRLPCGVNLKNGGRSYFMALNSFEAMDTLTALESGSLG